MTARFYFNDAGEIRGVSFREDAALAEFSFIETTDETAIPFITGEKQVSAWVIGWSDSGELSLLPISNRTAATGLRKAQDGLGPFPGSIVVENDGTGLLTILEPSGANVWAVRPAILAITEADDPDRVLFIFEPQPKLVIPAAFSKGLRDRSLDLYTSPTSTTVKLIR